jgi:DNA (cytosine-5)-methyltransferase 1
MNKLRVLDLFSGIGGFSLGLERTGGFETVAFCEIEEFPRRVLAKHWPEVPCYHDISTAEFGEAMDVVTAGFPCQDISIANQNATGLSGERSGLFWHIIRTVCMVGRPRLLLENVAELLKRGMGSILGALAQIGYDAQWHCIPASAVGASQERDRVWIIADPSEIRATRLLTSADIGAARQGRQGGQADLLHIANAAFERGDCHAEPLLRGMACRLPRRVDRVGSCGNSVDPAIPELIGNAILASIAAESEVA